MRIGKYEIAMAKMANPGPVPVEYDVESINISLIDKYIGGIINTIALLIKVSLFSSLSFVRL